MSNNDDFWLISVPGDKTPQESWEKLFKSVQTIASPFKFNIPPLNVDLILIHGERQPFLWRLLIFIMIMVMLS